MTKVTPNDLSKVLADNPLITAEGFEHGWKKTRPEYVPARVNIEEMQGAVNWLKQADRRVSINKSYSSYGLKHIAEKTAKGQYVSNGAFIAAAYFLGFTVKRIGSSPNARINISSKSVTKLRNKILTVVRSYDG
tara:strand:+ start:947 stop:1348 length:402 start_codon:yes stop_codon:yes gene_type:complete